MERSAISKRATHNSLYSMAVNGWYLLSRFLLTPYILHFLPLEEYGLWSLCFVIMSFLALTSIGFEGTYIKYVAEYHAREETEKINRLLSTGLILTCSIAVAFIIALWGGMEILLNILRIEEPLRPTATIIFMGTGVIFMLDISLNCFARALDGYQYLALTAKIRFWSSVLELLLIIPLLWYGTGIFGLMAAFLIRYFLVILTNIYFAYRLIPGLEIRFAYWEKEALKILISYGGKMQILGIIGIFMSTFDRVIITRILGLAATGLYEIGRKIPAKGSRIPAEISGAMMPALSHLQGKEDMEGARIIFLAASRYMALLAAPLFTYFIAVAPYAIYVWLGSGYEAATNVMYIISAGTMIHLLTGPSSASARGFNRLDWELKYSIATMILCIILTPILAILYGLTGAALGVALSTVLGSVYFIIMTHSFYGIELAEYLKKVIWPVVISVVSAAVVMLLLPTLLTIEAGSGAVETGRLTTALVIIAAGVVHLLLCVLLLTLTGGISPDERKWLRSKVFGKLRIKRTA